MWNCDNSCRCCPKLPRDPTPRWSSLPCWPWHLWPRWHVGWNWLVLFSGILIGVHVYACLSWMFTYFLGTKSDVAIPKLHKVTLWYLAKLVLATKIFLSTKVAVLTSHKKGILSREGWHQSSHDGTWYARGSNPMSRDRPLQKNTHGLQEFASCRGWLNQNSTGVLRYQS